MNRPVDSFRTVFATALVLGWAASSAAQVARVAGLVKDESGQPIKGATIRAENPDAPLGSLTAATDDKGRFAIIGLARGEWMFTAEAPGFQAQFTELNIVRTGTPLPPLVFAMPNAREGAAGSVIQLAQHASMPRQIKIVSGIRRDEAAALFEAVPAR